MSKPLSILLIFLSLSGAAQDTASVAAINPASPPDYHKRRWIIGGTSAAVTAGTFVLLQEAWYKDYPRSSFHSFDDASEWLQVDKVGHAWTAYSISRELTSLWQWAGVPRHNAMLLGTGTSLAFLLSIEYLDGRSAEWGWSWADAGADIGGAALFAVQELAWKEQRLSLKFSAHHTSYEPSLRSRAKELFGSSLPERLLKDYNAQTYWLSMNLRSFFPRSALPAWLNISAGYGAAGMFGGRENLAYDKNGVLLFDRRDIQRYRQWYLAPDIDLTRIPTRNKLLQRAFSMISILKFPAPALEFSSGKVRLKAIVF
ncbi:MAG TPA: DUF2279 domain-containing protein [Flavisolibacter sp.]